jgi:hypothetical protein
MFGFSKKDGYLCLVTEFVKGGDLSVALHQEWELDLSLKSKIHISMMNNFIQSTFVLLFVEGWCICMLSKSFIEI